MLGPQHGRIIIIDDDREIRESLRDFLVKEGYFVVLATTGEEGLDELRKSMFDVLLLDLKMPAARMDGFDALKKIRDEFHELYICILSAFDEFDTRQRAFKLGADDFIGKTFDSQMLFKRVRLAIDEVRLRLQKNLLKQQAAFQRIVGVSRQTQQILELVRRVGPTDATVLIEGETGTGKGVVARAIHEASKRAASLFVPVNCAAIPDELLASVIFGHVKGAFTGADNNKVGTFEYASGGTLFLDEISKGSLEFQQRTLNAIEEKVIYRLGSNELIRVDVRIIVATNRDLKKLAEEGKFLEDLYHRVNVIPIRVPPLRERVKDIPALLKHFIEEFEATLGKTVREVPQYVLDEFCAYSYPGNVRELRNIVERTIMLMEGETFTSQFLPSEQHATQLQEYLSLPLKQAIDGFEKFYLKRKLDETKGNKTQAARLAGIDVATLYRKLKSE